MLISKFTMKPEKEVIYLIKLYQSEYIKGFFKIKTACIKDFERICFAPENDKSFRIWINEMKEIGIIECVGKNSNKYGRNVDGFVVNRDLILKRLRNLDAYKNLVKFFDSRAMFGVDK